jgi:hypothetical protein
MNKLTSSQLKKYKLIGLNLKDILDLHSVKYKIRKACLIHIKKNKYSDLIKIINQLKLNIVAERTLYLYKDIKTHENLLYSKRFIKDTVGAGIGKKKNKNEFNHDDIKYSKLRFKKNYLGKTIELWVSQNEKISEKYFKDSGKYLSYPKCCVKFYEGKNTLSLHYNKYLNDKTFYWQLNRLTSLFNLSFLMPDFFPCSLNCKSALKLSNKYLNISKKIFEKKMYESVINNQKSPLLIYNNKIIHFGKWFLNTKNELFLYTNRAKVLNLKNIFHRKKFPNKLMISKNINNIKNVYFLNNKRKIKIKF